MNPNPPMTPAIQAALLLTRPTWQRREAVTRQGNSSLKKSPKRLTITKAAERFGVSKSAVGRHVKALKDFGIPYSSPRSGGRPRSLTPYEEDAICAYIIFCFHGRFPALQQMVIGAANKLQELRGATGKELDSAWLRRFLKDHKELRMTGYNAVDFKRRFFELNHASVNDWFDRYEQVSESIPPVDRWKADEVGARIGVVQCGRVKVVIL